MSIIYKGNAQIYLQGDDALLPIDLSNSDHVNFYLGAESSQLKVTDFRKEPTTMVHRIINGEDPTTFSDIFNQPAWIEVTVDQDNDDVSIELYDNNTIIDRPILWMGLLKGDRVPALDLQWEFFRSLNSTQTAFAALVR